MTPCKAPTRRRHAARGLRMAQNPHRSCLKCTASPTRPGHSTGWREKTRPAPLLHRHFRENTRPASTKTPNLGHFGRAGRTISRSHPPSDQAGRTFSRTRRDNVATLKPPSPLRTPEQQPLKPTSPLHPKNAPKPPISHPQRQRRFQPHASTHPQRRWRFQTTGPPGRQGPDAIPVAGGGAWPGFETTRRAKLAARTTRGRAAAHRHTQRPGPPAPGTPVGPQATSRSTHTRTHPFGHNKTARPQWGRAAVAVALGFEPRVAVTPHSISSAAPSAARTRYLTRILYYTLPLRAQIDRAGWEQGHTAGWEQGHTAGWEQGHTAG